MRRWSIRMCQNFWPMFVGAVCAAVAAVLTALKTGNVLLWPCAALIIGIGTVRAFQMRKYERRTERPDVPSRPSIGSRAMRSAPWSTPACSGVWCFVTIFGNNDAVAHMICVAVTVGYTAGGAARNLRPSQADPVSHPAGLRPDVAGAGDACRFLSTSASPRCWRCSSSASRASTSACTPIFVKALTSSFREAALAGQFDTALNNMPHGLCMFRADGRLAVMNYRFSQMMNLSDDLVQRGASAPTSSRPASRSDRFRRRAAR